MPESTHDLTLLLKNIQAGLQDYSVKELNEAIIDFLNKKGNKHKEVNFVLDTVAKHFKVSRRTLIKTYPSGQVGLAKKICYCLLHYSLGLTNRYIAMRVFQQTSASRVNETIRYYRTLNPKVKVDKDFGDLYETFHRQLTEFIENNKTN